MSTPIKEELKRHLKKIEATILSRNCEKATSEKATKIAGIINREKMINLQDRYVITQIMEKLLNESIPTGRAVRAPGNIVVLLENPNCHNYPLHQPVMLQSYPSSMGITTKLLSGNNLPIIEGRAVRPADRDEIKHYFKCVNKLLDSKTYIPTYITVEIIRGISRSV